MSNPSLEQRLYYDRRLSMAEADISYCRIRNAVETGLIFTQLKALFPHANHEYLETLNRGNIETEIPLILPVPFSEGIISTAPVVTRYTSRGFNVSSRLHSFMKHFDRDRALQLHCDLNLIDGRVLILQVDSFNGMIMFRDSQPRLCKGDSVRLYWSPGMLSNSAKMVRWKSPTHAEYGCEVVGYQLLSGTGETIFQEVCTELPMYIFQSVEKD